MTAPLISQPTKILTQYGRANPYGFRPVIYERRIYGNRQRSPHNVVSPWLATIQRVESFSSSNPVDYKAVGSVGRDGWMVDMRLKALNGLRDAISSSADMATNAAEHRKSMDMISNRANQFGNFVVQVRRGNFKKAASILGLTKVPGGVKGRAKRLGSNILEYSFGWAPLVSDIGNAVDVLQNPIKSSFVRKRAKMTTVNLVTSSMGSKPGFSSKNWLETTKTYGVELSTLIKITNPNLHLANSMGFANPAGVIWELTPYSFLVDYFVNVQDFLTQYTSFLGIEFVSPRTTEFFKGTETSIYYAETPKFGSAFVNGQWVPYHDGYTSTNRSSTISDVSVQRTATISTAVPLRFKPPWNISPSRAATSVGLLLVHLRD